MTIRCGNCNRRLIREPIYVSGVPLGPKCAFAYVGAKAKRVRVARRRDPRQVEMFAGEANG